MWVAHPGALTLGVQKKIGNVSEWEPLKYEGTSSGAPKGFLPDALKNGNISYLHSDPEAEWLRICLPRRNKQLRVT